MKSISKAIRHKRYHFKAPTEVGFLIELYTGEKIEIVPDNCSIMGIGGFCKTELPDELALEIDTIVPNAKLSWKDHEYGLGRIVLRTKVKREGRLYLGFSLVDSKVPLDGHLTSYLESYDGGTKPYDVELCPEKFTLAHFAETNESNVDIFARCQTFSVYHKEWKRTAKYQYNTVRAPSTGSRVHLTKKRPNKRTDYIAMGAYDYLGLASHPRVTKAAKEGIDKFGISPTGSPLLTGLTTAHEELAERLAKKLKKDAVLLFNSGFSANLAAMTALTGSQDLILADILSHASLQDGLKGSSSTVRFFKHNDTHHLEKNLKRYRKEHAGALVVTEGVFSMEGDIAPLKDIVEVKNKYNARLFFDEAHSFGILGPNLMGVSDQCSLLDEVDIYMSSLSKSCGAGGAFIAGPKEMIEWLNFYARPYMFSVALHPTLACAALESLKVMEEQPELAQKLQENIKHFVTGLRQLGAPLDEHHSTPIVPAVIKDERKLGIMNQYMMEKGVFAIPIVYPAVSRTQCRFRFSITNTLSISDLDFALNTFEQAMAKANFSFAEPNDDEQTEGTRGAEIQAA